jgi:hypothetical protein
MSARELEVFQVPNPPPPFGPHEYAPPRLWGGWCWRQVPGPGRAILPGAIHGPFASEAEARADAAKVNERPSCICGPALLERVIGDDRHLPGCPRTK